MHTGIQLPWSQAFLVLFVMVLLFAAVPAGSAHAELVRQAVPYTHQGVALIGYLVYEGSLEGRRPGIVVVHEWWGLNDYAKGRADELASLGYVAFAIDMYGGGKTTTDPAVAGQWAGALKGNPEMGARARAGLDVLARNDRVDPTRLGAIGFCFGGTTALELAWTGAPLRGVVSFHGGLIIPPPDGKGIQASILVLHGADDPFEKAESIAAFQDALRKGGLDWQMIYYGGAMHSFTNPTSKNSAIPGVMYNEKAALRSWQHMKLFFAELFGKDSPDSSMEKK